MSEINDAVELPNELLDSIVGGALSEYERHQFREVTEELQRRGFLFHGVMGFWHQQLDGTHFNDEDWQEIEGIVRSVFEE